MLLDNRNIHLIFKSIHPSIQFCCHCCIVWQEYTIKVIASRENKQPEKDATFYMLYFIWLLQWNCYVQTLPSSPSPYFGTLFTYHQRIKTIPSWMINDNEFYTVLLFSLPLSNIILFANRIFFIFISRSRYSIITKTFKPIWAIQILYCERSYSKAYDEKWENE